MPSSLDDHLVRRWLKASQWYCGVGVLRKTRLHADKDETLGGLVALNLGCEVYGVEES